MDLSQKTLGAKIAALRKIRNMTQEQLAAQLGISAPAVSSTSSAGWHCRPSSNRSPSAQAAQSSAVRQPSTRR